MNGFDFSTASDIRLGSTTVSAVYYGSTKLWPSSQPSHDYSLDYLTFEALESGTFTWTDAGNSNTIYYSTDNGSTWNELASGSSTPTIAANSKVCFGGLNPIVGTTIQGIGTFSSTGRFNAMGNIMSLLDGNNFTNLYSVSANQFAALFRNCSNLVNANNLVLPATTAANYCYWGMFRDCTSLTTVPELPATTLGSRCYASMFNGCTSLTTAPELPATTLASNCYSYMFSGCTSLTTAPELSATTLASYCYEYMFRNCTSLTTAPELSATTLVNACYFYMFSGCTSLTTAPELPATTLTAYCYYYMFSDCTSLNNVTCLATSLSGSSTTTNWLSNVATSGTFVKNSSTWWPTGVNGIPSGWTVRNAS